jgi:hypothetical protein
MKNPKVVHSAATLFVLGCMIAGCGGSAADSAEQHEKLAASHRIEWHQVGAPQHARKIAFCTGNDRLYALNDDHTLWENRHGGDDSQWRYIDTPGHADQIFCTGSNVWAFNDDRTLWISYFDSDGIHWERVGNPYGAAQVTGDSDFMFDYLYALNDDKTLWFSYSGSDGTWKRIGKPFAADRIATFDGIPFALNNDKTLWRSNNFGADGSWVLLDKPWAAVEIAAAAYDVVYALNYDHTLWRGVIFGP